ncbi:hypothetical protein BN961_00733 [Afipia felis]|uniref:DUF2971 domain-containing protein n=1 Tax=Afipia felis TaxID=1035 RepID=A0A090MNX4_AFIFE|nr:MULTISPECIES: DUF2971 domain-containing protein [Afipia]EFI52187.1 hypothetical protein AfiDRAFT_0173 [Afipia sp. 1NLS2]CEG07344.1 hypothetical protein BN961_00733 [Afipia felis]
MALHARPAHWRHDRGYFFKYTDIRGARAILQSRKLKWSPASAFNDPFDMQFDLHLEFNEDALVEACRADFKKILLGEQKFDPGIGLGAVLSRLRAAASRIPSTVLDSFIEDGLRLTIQNIPKDITVMHKDLRAHFAKYKVLCLSSINDSILMWSHYADHHRGVVLRLACLEETDSSWSVARPVVYVDKMPRFVEEKELRDLITGKANLQNEIIVERTIFYKATAWQYENEWRIYLPSDNAEVQFNPFNPPELTGIYFGCRSSEADREELVSVAKAINPALSVFQARKAEREFALEFDKFI